MYPFDRTHRPIAGLWVRTAWARIRYLLGTFRHDTACTAVACRRSNLQQSADDRHNSPTHLGADRRVRDRFLSPRSNRNGCKSHRGLPPPPAGFCGDLCGYNVSSDSPVDRVDETGGGVLVLGPALRAPVLIVGIPGVDGGVVLGVDDFAGQGAPVVGDLGVVVEPVGPGHSLRLRAESCLQAVQGGVPDIPETRLVGGL